MYNKKISLIGLVALAFATTALAQTAPGLVNYQGRLMGSDGFPVNGLSTAMTFSLWNAQSGGTVLWSESKPVDVNEGLYSVMLGDSVAIPDSVFSGSTVYLEIVVLGETLTPRQRLTSVPYALQADNAGLLDNLDSTAFALANHTHDFSELTGTASDAQIPDNITIDVSQNTLALNGFTAGAYVMTSGGTVTGSLQVNGQLRGAPDLVVANNLSVLGGNVGLGVTAQPAYGLLNNSVSPPNYGASFYGAAVGVRGEAPLSTNTFGILGQDGAGVTGYAGTSSSATGQYGGNFTASSASAAYGVYGQSYGYGASGNAVGARGYATATDAGYAMGGEFTTDTSGTGTHYGVYSTGLANSSSPVYASYNYASNSTGAAYGGYFYTSPTGTGPRYGIVVSSVGNSGIFENGELHVGTGGSENYIGGGDGDLYVKAMAEIDGGAYIQGDPAVYAQWSGDPSYDHVALGSQDTAVEGHIGTSTETGAKYGGYFQASASDYTYGLSGIAYGYSTQTTYGTYSFAGNYSTGPAYGGYFSGGGSGTGQHTGIYASGISSGSATSTGVYGYANSSGTGILYGGKFDTSSGATGSHYGVYATSDGYALYGQNNASPDSHGYIGSPITAVQGAAGSSSSTDYKVGGSFSAYSQNSAYALESYAYGYAGYANYGLYSYSTNYSNGTAFGAYLYASSTNGPAYGLYVAGGTKNWVNPDPEDPTKSIVYATLEGGENGTYYRGTARLQNGRAVIEMPDHFRKVTSPDQPVTVQVTPSSAESLGLAVTKKSNSEIVVEELYHGRGNYEFDYLVQGVRLGYEDYEPIIDNEDYVPFQGNQANLDPSKITTQEWYDSQSKGLKKIFKKNGTLDANGKVNEALFKEKGWKEVKGKASDHLPGEE